MTASSVRPLRFPTPAMSRPSAVLSGMSHDTLDAGAAEHLMSRTHAAGLDAVVSAVDAGTACTVLIGEDGVGKTSVLNAVAAQLAERPEAVAIIKVSHPLPPPLEFQRLIGAPLGLVDADRMTPNEIARRLTTDQPGTARRVVLMVDDAHRLPPATLLYLRLVSDLFCVRAPRLQVVLVGRPPLLEILLRPELAGRFVDTAVHVELSPLNAAEMSHYIAYRVGVSGCTLRGSFGRGALRCVIDHAEGIPRRADRIIERALRRGPDGLSRPITLKRLRENGVDTGPAGLPGGRALWIAAAAVGGVACLVGGGVAWQGIERSRAWLVQAPQLLEQATGRGATPATPPAPAASPGLTPPMPSSAPPVVAASPARRAPETGVPQADAPTAGASQTTAATNAPTNAADAEIVRLMHTADTQIAAGNISAPADDNVILTFQRLNDVLATASQDGRRVVETMNTHFATQARLALEAGRTEEARRFRQFAGDPTEAPPAAAGAAVSPPLTLETQPAAPLPDAKPASPPPEVKPASPPPEVKPASPPPEVKPASPPPEVKPASPLSEVKPASPPSEVKPASPPTLEVQPAAPRLGRPGAGPRETALPLNAPIRLSLIYSRNNPDADTRAAGIAATLRDTGLQVGRPSAGDRRATALVIRYFFAEDRDGAALVARRLSGLIGQTAALELTRRDPMPVPGSVEALIP